jgi:hypothetical protein
METLGKAQLTEEIAPQQAVVAYVPREEIMTVLRDPEAQPELELQIHGGDEPSRISMEWSRNELEDLLARATGDTVVLTFDRDELALAFADVEAHGMREKALVFAVCATGALGVGAGVANAQLAPPGDGGPVVTSVAPASYTDASSGGGYAAAAATTPAADQISDAASGSGYAAAATGSAADTMVTDASSGAGYAATGSAADTMVTDASSGAGYAAAATGSAADTMRTDASTGGYTAPAGASSGATFSIHKPDTTDTFLVAGVLLTIAGAGFVASRRRTPIQPA